jgi:hypothetical protein
MEPMYYIGLDVYKRTTKYVAAELEVLSLGTRSIQHAHGTLRPSNKCL